MQQRRRNVVRVLRRFGSIVGGRGMPVLMAIGFVVSVTAGGERSFAEEETPVDADARVFFVEPGDGATVTSPVKLVFGSENVEVGAVPDEVETPRKGVIHYHLALNADCLPPGTVIPQANPWIHFGDGSKSIDMTLPPGEHRLVVQAGDDEHRTIEGLCETISITVAEED